jgi:hypothetical protein
MERAQRTWLASLVKVAIKTRVNWRLCRYFSFHKGAAARGFDQTWGAAWAV